VLANWYSRLTSVEGIMVERFLIELKSVETSKLETGLRMITGAADGDGDRAAAHSSNALRSS
jgi:hypothetical protein